MEHTVIYIWHFPYYKEKKQNRFLDCLDSATQSIHHQYVGAVRHASLPALYHSFSHSYSLTGCRHMRSIMSIFQNLLYKIHTSFSNKYYSRFYPSSAVFEITQFWRRTKLKAIINLLLELIRGFFWDYIRIYKPYIYMIYQRYWSNIILHNA